jgi:hypothetical protein
MTDAEAPAPRPWIHRHSTALMVAALLLLGWSILANQWKDKGCGMLPQSYVMVVSHGTPDHWQGCDEYGDYTDQYGG